MGLWGGRVCVFLCVGGARVCVFVRVMHDPGLHRPENVSTSSPLHRERKSQVICIALLCTNSRQQRKSSAVT